MKNKGPIEGSLWRYAVSTACCLPIAFPSFVWANPSGEVVSHGSATFERSGNSLIIRQGTDKLITKWDQFSIAQGERTQFIQPTKSSAALNRVVGGSRSLIDGELSANGKVILINPAGVTVGPTGVVNVNSFTASTHDLSDQEFIGGGELLYKGASPETIENHGVIHASGGDAILIAKHVKNNGSVEAPNGTAALVGGMEVLVKPTGEERIFIKPGSEKGSTVTQTAAGRLSAASAEVKAAGSPWAAAINLEGLVDVRATDPALIGKIKVDAGSGNAQIAGTIKARNANGSGGAIQIAGTNLTFQPGSQLDASGSTAGGSIRVQAENLLHAEGAILAQGTTATGGMIELYGKTIELMATALVDASSAQTNGGQIYTGGGYQGKDVNKPNADNVSIAPGAKLLANAGLNGNGGKVIVWGNQNTLFSGTIEAKGGTIQGDGGFAEVSSPGQLAYHGTANLLAAKGLTGSLLLDPTNVIILDSATTVGEWGYPGATTGMSFASGTYSGNNATSYLTTQDLVTQLSLANVTVQTTNSAVGGVAVLGLNALTGNVLGGTIVVKDQILWNAPTSLTLQAHNDIVVANHIINANPGAGSGITLTADSDLANGGAVFVGTTGATFDGVATQTAGISIETYGAIQVTGQQVLVLGGGSGAPARIGNGSVVGVGADAIGANATIRIDALGGNFAGSTLINAAIPDPANLGAVILLGGNVKNSEAQIGHGGAGNVLVATGGVTATNADITVNAFDGGVSLIGGTTNSYAQIGHGGSATEVQGSVTGNIVVNSGSATSLDGGRVMLHADPLTDGSYAQIGFGGLNGIWTGGASGDIDIDVENANTTGLEVYGGGENAYAQIGHGGGGLIVGTSVGTTAQNWSGAVGVNVTLTDTTLNPVGIQIGLPDPTLAGENAYAQIGHGGADFQAYVLNEFGGAVGMTLGNTDPLGSTRMIVTGAAGDSAYSQIGHGGARSTVVSAGTLGGTLGITLGSRVEALQFSGNRNGATAAGFVTSYAQLGHGGASSNFTAVNIPDSTITVKVNDGRLNLLGGYMFDSYAQIGHKGTLTTGAGLDIANILVTATQIIDIVEGFYNTVTPPSFSLDGTYAQIGHNLGWTKSGIGDVSSTMDISAGTTPGPKGQKDIIVGYFTERFASSDHGLGYSAQVGHNISWTHPAAGSFFGSITASPVNGDLYIAHSDTNAQHQIGHGFKNGLPGTLDFDGALVIPITVNVQGEVLVWGSTGTGGTSLIGHTSSPLSANSMDLGIEVNILSGGAAAKTHRVMGGIGESFGAIGHLIYGLQSDTDLDASIAFNADAGSINNLTIGGIYPSTPPIAAGGFSVIGSFIQGTVTTGTGTTDLGIEVSASSLQMLSGNAANGVVAIGNLIPVLNGSGDINMDVSVITTNGIAMTAGTGGFIGAVSIGQSSSLAVATLNLGSGSTFSAAINVNAGNGALTMTAGTGDLSLVQIGNSWQTVVADSDTFNLGIDVTAVGDITLTGGSGEASYALIGHAGYVNTTGIPVPAPNWQHTNAELGADLSINVSSTGGDLSLSSGSATNTIAQIGHSFAGSSSDRGQLTFSSTLATVQAGITVSAIAGTLSLDATSSATPVSGVQIGHGGTNSYLDFTAALEAPIIAAAGRGISAQVENAYIQIGNGGASSQIELRPAVNDDPLTNFILVRSLAGNINLQALPGGIGYIQIGHGGEGMTTNKPSLLAGNISVQADVGSVIATAASPVSGSAQAGFVKFGHGGEFFTTNAALFNYAGTIDLAAGTDIALTSSVQGRIHVGHAHFLFPVINPIVGNSNITLLANRDISLVSDGGTHTKGSTFIMNFGELVDPLTGSDDLILSAGRDVNFLTRNGTIGSVIAMSLGGDTQVAAGRNVTLDGSTAGTNSFNIISAENLLTLAVDVAASSSVGSCGFYMSSTAMLGLSPLIPFGASVEQLRIYTGARSLNTIQTGATFWVQGNSYTFLAGPTTGVTNPNGNWTYRTLYDSGQREQWSTVWNGTLNGGGTFTSPFTVFYKDNATPPGPPIPPTPPVIPVPSSSSRSAVVSLDFPYAGQILGQEFDPPTNDPGYEMEKYYKRKNFQIRVRARDFARALQPIGFTLTESDILNTVRKGNRFSIERSSFISESSSSRRNFEFVAR